MGARLFFRTSLRDHARSIKYYLLAVVFLALVLQCNVLIHYLKMKHWLHQLNKQAGAKYNENSAETQEQMYRVHPHALIPMAVYTNALGESGPHISRPAFPISQVAT